MKINLKELREDAKRLDDNGKSKSVTREELSLMLEENLGRKIHVTQIARYEDNPGSVPLELLIPWLRCLGTSIEDQVAAAAIQSDQPIFDPGSPYEKLRSRTALLQDYLASVKEDPTLANLPDNMPNLMLAAEMVKRISRKPNLVLSGAFDVGKSTLANWLMGSDNALPTNYQPTTAVVTYIRHSEDQPSWLREDVVLLNENFEPDRWEDQQHVQEHRIISGNLETLRQYGTHMGGRFPDSGASTALVFLDRPVLKACNLIDFPGYANSEQDTERSDKALRHLTEIANRRMNVLLYASTATGFMYAQEMERLRYLLKQLPQYERREGFPALGNLFIIATHAGPQISDVQLFGKGDGLLDTATERIWRELAEHELSMRSEETTIPIYKETVRRRIFPFWRENIKRTRDLAEDIHILLSQLLPRVIHQEADDEVLRFKDGASDRYRTTILSYEKTLNDIDAAKALFEQKLKDEPARRKEVAVLRKRVKTQIDETRAEHLQEFSKAFESELEVAAIEQQIRKRYGDNKKEAQQFIAGFIINGLQTKSEKFAKQRCKAVIIPIIEKYISSYEDASGINVGSKDMAVDIPFDSRGSFIGGLAGLGSIGALSLWASGLGNLGGYIIAAKGVSILASLGIATGGTAGAMGLLSAIGGPVTLGIGIAVALFFGFRALFGDSWQLRLARQIVEKFGKEKVAERFATAISTYWGETEAAFEQAADKVEQEFVAEMNHLRDAYTDPKKKGEAERMVEGYRRAQDFFVGMPWVVLHPVQAPRSST